MCLAARPPQKGSSKIQNEQINKVRWYRKEAIPEAPVPLLGGPDLIDPRQIPEISAAARESQPEAATVDDSQQAAEETV
jgi:hypothetical protein